MKPAPREAPLPVFSLLLLVISAFILGSWLAIVTP